MDERTLGRLVALAEQTHDAVNQLRVEIASVTKTVRRVETEQAVQRVWIRVLLGVFGVGVIGGGGIAGALRLIGAP